MQRIVLFALMFTVAIGCLGSAQEVPPKGKVVPIKWRTDYNTARKESQERALPLVIVVTIPNTYWQRLEKETLTNPQVASILNERCVPLFIDHSKDPSLGTHLKINLFPTIFIATDDGKVLDKLVGFQNAERMLKAFLELDILERADEKKKP